MLGLQVCVSLPSFIPVLWNFKKKMSVLEEASVLCLQRPSTQIHQIGSISCKKWIQCSTLVLKCWLRKQKVYTFRASTLFFLVFMRIYFILNYKMAGVLESIPVAGFCFSCPTHVPQKPRKSRSVQSPSLDSPIQSMPALPKHSPGMQPAKSGHSGCRPLILCVEWPRLAEHSWGLTPRESGKEKGKNKTGHAA